MTKLLPRLRHKVLCNSISYVDRVERSELPPGEPQRAIIAAATSVQETAGKLLQLIIQQAVANSRDHPPFSQPTLPNCLARSWQRIEQEYLSVEASMRDTLEALLSGDKVESRLPLFNRAACNVELARIISGAEVVLLDSSDEVPESQESRRRRRRDPFGVGSPYAKRLTPWWDRQLNVRLIATHAGVDADALTSSWLACKYMFPNERSEIVFVTDFDASSEHSFDCVVDTGGMYDPQRCVFDHNRKAVENPRSTCASRQIWEYLRDAGCHLDHLEELVSLVHDGDNWDHTSEAWKNSKRNGLHAQIRTLRKMKMTDAVKCRTIHAWLSANHGHGGG